MYTGAFNFWCMGQIAVCTAYMHTGRLNFEIWPQSKQKSQPKLSCVHAYTGTSNFWSMGQIAVCTAYMPTELLNSSKSQNQNVLRTRVHRNFQFLKYGSKMDATGTRHKGWNQSNSNSQSKANEKRQSWTVRNNRQEILACFIGGVHKLRKVFFWFVLNHPPTLLCTGK